MIGAKPLGLPSGIAPKEVSKEFYTAGQNTIKAYKEQFWCSSIK